jgi:hypothetical protein
VAALVAEGLSNQQVATRMFLSRHTVDFHLRHIFRKLGIASRVALTRITLCGEAPPAPVHPGAPPRDLGMCQFDHGAMVEFSQSKSSTR